jgi:TonB family protein
MLTASLILHVAFYAIVLKLDQWSFNRLLSRSRTGGEGYELVKLTDVAAPHERLPAVRRRPDPVERVDLSRLRLDLSNPDDTRLIARSPNPSRLRGPGPAGAGSTNGVESRDRLRPPVVDSIELNRTSQPLTTPLSQAIISPSATQPPPPQQQKQTEPEPSGGRDTRGHGQGAGELGLAVIQSQYIALVRSKIWKTNEWLMPRDWIESMLTRKVSADFELELVRPGRVGSLRLVRSSGYSTLDRMARQAINTASPFEGFPQEAGDALTFTVTVYYTPFR